MGIKERLNIENLRFVIALVMFGWLCWYFYTGFGGASQLVASLVPIALMLRILRMHQDGYIYKKLPPLLNNILVVIYMGICVFAFYHFTTQYDEIAIWRQGSYTRTDFVMGLLIFLLVMELSRVAHNELFWVNLALVLYTMFGYLSPIDFFWHPGASFYRIVTSSTVELSTGIYGQYAQIALTTIAAFLLLAAAANGFGAQGAMVHFMRRIAGKSRATIPQTAVLASSAVGMVSGSGAANASVVGAFTIPLMKKYGMPGEIAAAVETSASMGGLIMPPVMAVAGFVMAEFLGVRYWEVVLRGFALAFTYYSTLALSLYLISVRLMPPEPIEKAEIPLYEQLKTGVFFSGIIVLTIFMGVLHLGEQLAGLYTGALMFSMLAFMYLFFKYVKGDAAAQREAFWPNVKTMIMTHAEMTSFLTLLLCTLGIMVGLFTVTGFINRMGAMLLKVGEWHVVALVLMAWIFGWLVGLGLPPTATYIVLAVIIVDPMRKLGIDPWVAHFFCFLLAVWGELSPPTSLTAAVSARIAEASFMRTMYEALRLCLPITLMTFAIFVRSQLVVKPGWGQVLDMMLVAVGCWGVSFSMFGRSAEKKVLDLGLRLVVAPVSFGVLLYLDRTSAIIVAGGLLLGLCYLTFTHRRICREHLLVRGKAA